MPLVVAEGLLIKVAVEVEWLDRNISAANRTLQQAPEILKAIRVNVTVNVGFCMVDDFMRVLGIKTRVGLQGVSVKLGASGNVFANLFLKMMLPSVLHNRKAYLAGLAFEQPKHNSFTHSASAGNLSRPLTSVHVPRFAADESLISLNGPGHFIDRSVMLRVTNSVQHEPCRLLRYAKRTGDLVARYTVLAICEHPHRAEPLIKTNGGILENGSDLNRELFAASEARPHQPRLEKRQLLALAAWALGTIRPLSFGNSFEARQWVGKVAYGIQQTALIIEVNRFHESIITLESM